MSAATPLVALPETLPADAKGYTKRMVMHLNYGDEGGAANYTIHGAGGVLMPIVYQYDTRKKGANPTGWFLDDCEQKFNSWGAVVDYWPTWLAARRAEGPA